MYTEPWYSHLSPTTLLDFHKSTVRALSSLQSNSFLGSFYETERFLPLDQGILSDEVPVWYHNTECPEQKLSKKRKVSVKYHRYQKEICNISCNILPCLGTVKMQATSALLLDLSNCFTFQYAVSITLYGAPQELWFTLCKHYSTVSKPYHSYFRQAFLVTVLQEVSYFRGKRRKDRRTIL